MEFQAEGPAGMRGPQEPERVLAPGVVGRVVDRLDGADSFRGVARADTRSCGVGIETGSTYQ